MDFVLSMFHVCLCCAVLSVLAAMRSPAEKRLTFWLSYVFSCALSLSHLVSGVRCGTQRFLIFAFFFTMNYRSTLASYKANINVSTNSYLFCLV